MKFSGNFDDNGAAQILSARQGKSGLTTTLQFDSADETVTGSVTDAGFVAQIKAYRNVFSPSYPALDYEGKYKVVVPGATGVATVDALGNVTFLGTLTNGTGVSQASAVSRDGYWPFYLQRSGANETFWSWNQFTNGAVRSLPGLPSDY